MSSSKDPAPLRSLALLFLVGAALGSFFDGFHTHGGVTVYPDPWLLRMAWWTPLVFGVANLSIGLTHVWLDQQLRRPARARSPGRVVVGLCYFGVFYALSAFLPLGNLAKLAVLLGGWALLWTRNDRTWQGAVESLLTAAVGCPIEAAIAATGAFAHRRPDHFGVPIWLPALYMIASLAVGDLGRLLLTRRSAQPSPPALAV